MIRRFDHRISIEMVMPSFCYCCYSLFKLHVPLIKCKIETLEAKMISLRIGHRKGCLYVWMIMHEPSFTLLAMLLARLQRWCQKLSISVLLLSSSPYTL